MRETFQTSCCDQANSETFTLKRGQQSSRIDSQRLQFTGMMSQNSEPPFSSMGFLPGLHVALLKGGMMTSADKPAGFLNIGITHSPPNADVSDNSHP
jgi:hypothetical protein